MPAPPFHIVKASFTHIPHLACAMRPSDKAEIWAAHAILPRAALEQSLALSTSAWCVITNTTPIAMWGVGAARTTLSQTGAPWLLATDDFYGLKRPFIRLSRKYIELMHTYFPLLENHVHAKNHASIRWLRWCGFHLDKNPYPYGPFNEPFYRFWRKQCAT